MIALTPGIVSPVPGVVREATGRLRASRPSLHTWQTIWDTAEVKGSTLGVMTLVDVGVQPGTGHFTLGE
jgi:hypothetical protein